MTDYDICDKCGTPLPPRPGYVEVKKESLFCEKIIGRLYTSANVECPKCGKIKHYSEKTEPVPKRRWWKPNGR